jgi:circadian clock protein KaiC
MITGSPGTAKTSLAGAFTEAAGLRGERVVYVAFDEPVEEIVRNLSSVNIHLQKQVDEGSLRIYKEYVGSHSAEEHFQRIRMLVQKEDAKCLVIDPFTAFSAAGDLGSTQAVAARLVRWVKSRGVTMVCTSLPLPNESGFAGTLLNITSVADTWIYLNFFDGGERNRGLTIIKSRGTNHSNQVRELILASSGISLAAPYTAEGTVLMGTMRWQKELAEAETRSHLSAEFERKSAAIDEELAELDGRVQVLQRNIAAKRMAQGSMLSAEERRRTADQRRYSEMVELRKVGELDAGKDLFEPTEEPSDEKSHP